MNTPHFTLDGELVPFEPGDTLMMAARREGRYLPYLCWHPELGQSGACRVCTVKVDGRLSAACTTRAAAGLNVENRTAELDGKRKLLLQMLFVEGNHFCPGCEKSGDCRLQSTAYEMGMTDLHFEEFYPARVVDASHADIWIDYNRCMLCKLCVRASREVDGKDVFALRGHGIHTQLLVNSPSGKLVDSELEANDMASRVCPVGALLPKRRGFVHPFGERTFDRVPPSQEAASQARAGTGASTEQAGHDDKA